MSRLVVIVEAQSPDDLGQTWSATSGFRICGAEYPPSLDEESYESYDDAVQSAVEKGFSVVVAAQINKHIFSPPDVEQDSDVARSQSMRRARSFSVYASALSGQSSMYRILRLVVYLDGRVADQDLQPLCPFVVFPIGDTTAADALSSEDLAVLRAKQLAQPKISAVADFVAAKRKAKQPPKNDEPGEGGGPKGGRGPKGGGQR